MRTTTFFNAVRRCVLVSTFLSSAVLTACATLPDVESIIQEMPHLERAPEIFDSRGTLSDEERETIIHGLEGQAGCTNFVKQYIPFMGSITEFPLIAGNKVTLFRDSPDIDAAMFRAIQSAKNHINLETFSFADDKTGRHLAELLLQKRTEGVQVNLIYDSAGCFCTPPSFFQRLRDGGVRAVEFNPLGPADAMNIFNRDHRKILIVDGMIAFAGGVNIVHTYSRSMHRESEAKDGGLCWRDTHIQIEGPVVADLQKLFLDTWEKKKGPQLPRQQYFPSRKNVGDDLVRIVGSTPGKMNRVTYMMYVAAITFAENRIHLTNAYFAPDEDLIIALVHAAERGVDVKIILPGISDWSVVSKAGRSYYSRLLKAGVKLYERRGTVLHAKTGVIDGVWSTVGTTNLDLWSLLRNNEVNVVILGEDFARHMEDMFTLDLAGSDQIRLEEWEKRSLGQRVKEWFARLFVYWL